MDAEKTSSDLTDRMKRMEPTADKLHGCTNAVLFQTEKLYFGGGTSTRVGRGVCGVGVVCGVSVHFNTQR